MAARTGVVSGEDQGYLLPDHWLLPEESIWTLMHHAYVRRVVEHVQTSGARVVLELGCGDGWNCGKLALAGLDVTGVDWSRNAIDHARRMVPSATFLCGDIRDPAVASLLAVAYDAVVLVEVLEHIPPADCPGVLRGIRALLRPGGVLVLTTPSVNFPNENSQHYRHFDEATLRSLIESESQMVVEAIEGYGDVPRERRYYRCARWVDNRYYLLKPVRRWLQARIRPHLLGAGFDRCHGFIVRARRPA